MSSPLVGLQIEFTLFNWIWLSITLRFGQCVYIFEDYGHLCVLDV